MTNLGPHRSSSWPIRVAVATSVLALVVMLGRLVVTIPSAEAHADATFTVLYSFKGGTDGANPYASLVGDSAGNLYGTTLYGGASGFGTVFKLDATGAETVLHSFTGVPDGRNPYAGLVRDAAGNLYGTTYYGGASNNCFWGCGTVFVLDTTGKETVLHSFTGFSDGANPYAGLVRDQAGNLYGTTLSGGNAGYGTVFKLDTTGTKTVLHSFTNGNDGVGPRAGLLRDPAGNLYGTTAGGGANNDGMVFKLDTTGAETVLHTFTGEADGEDGVFPYAGLIRDPAGNLYGTTLQGGPFGRGSVFKLDATKTETVLHNFTGGTDGSYPYAGLVRDPAGNFYGTTRYGGVSNKGTVFKVDTAGVQTRLHIFRGGTTDGAFPMAGLVRDPAGNLYGTTSFGGAFGKGTIFKLSR